MLKRNILWIMLVLMVITNTFIFLSMSIAIVAMVNRHNTSIETAVSEQPTEIVCPNTTFLLREFFKSENSTLSSKFSEKTGFDWSEAEQSTILSGFFRLAYLSIFPGGILSHKYGSKLVIGCAQFVIAVVSSCIPSVATMYGPAAVSWLRSIQGLLSNMAAPTAVFTIIGKWSPPQERGKFGASLMVGIAIGESLGSFLFGYIAEYLHWKYVFYLSSVCGLICSVVWYMLVHDSPAQHPTISFAEREYIENSLNESSHKNKVSIPWKSIITNGPLIIIVLAVGAGNWSFIMLNTYSPLYLKTVYGMNSNEVDLIGIISSVPYFSMIFIAALGAYFGDLLVKNGLMSITGVRKTCTFLGAIVAAVAMVIIAFAKCNLTLAISCILFICIVRVFAIFGSPLGVLDLSPNFAGVLEGVVGTLAALNVFAFSTVVNYLTEILAIEEMWKVVFLFTGLYCIVMNLVYIIFGTSEVQSWNFENREMENTLAAGKEMKTLLRSILQGICETIGMLSGFISPALVSMSARFYKDDPLQLWKLVWFVTGVIYVVPGLIFVLFSNSELQPWNEVKEKPADEELMEKER